MSKPTFEIIKVDDELSECPETGIRYFGFAKQVFTYNNGKKSVSWELLSSGKSIPWAYSQEEIISRARKINDEWENYEISQVLIFKSELPIKKLIIEE